MELDQGTAISLQDNLETPPNTIVEDDNVTLTDEQKEELVIAEETKKLVTENDTPAVQKRINQAVKKWRTEERARIKAEKEGTETKAVLDEMRQHNTKLYNAIQRMSTATETLVDVQSGKAQQDASQKELADIQYHIAYLKSERVKARQEYDYSKEATIEDQIDAYKEQLLAKKQAYAQQQKKAPNVNDKYENGVIAEWTSTTAWFSPIVDDEPNPEYNPAMEKAARVYDQHLLQMERWQGVPIEKRLEEVKKKIEEKFGYEAKKHGTSKIPTVESGNGLPPPKKSTAETLSDEQKHVARRLFSDKSPSEAEKIYADQIKILKGGN